MKKQLLTTVLAVAASSMFAQLPVSTSPQNRKVVLEEFTGVHCGYCPDGHKRAEDLKTANPGNVILINIHSGSFANVNPGEPDFKTTEGNSIDAMTGMAILGYPAGAINRTNMGSNSTPSYAQQTVSPWGMAQSRGTWSATSTQTNGTNPNVGILMKPSYVNVALQGSLDVQTRVLTVAVEVYYTANSPASTNSLNVFLLENKQANIQSNYGNPPYNIANYNQDGSYNHNHLLRKALTPTFGMTIPNTTSGTTFTTTLTYTIPLTYGAAGKTTVPMLGNLELAAFVTETDRPVINGANGPVYLTNFANTIDIGENSMTNDAAVCSGTNFATGFKFTNYGSQTVTAAVFTLSMNGAAPASYTYTGAPVLPMTTSQKINLNLSSFTPQASNTMVIGVQSVNGSPDNVTGNNTVSGTAPLTNITPAYIDATMYFNQDRWGSECTWTVIAEASGAVISSDGPFSDLGANGTQMHTKNFPLSSNTCYKLIVQDSYGDGINSGAGAGGYWLVSGTGTFITSNGMYGTGESKWYKSTVFTGIATAVENISAVGVYPNPASNSANISIELSQNEVVNVAVLNALGQEVYSSKLNSFAAGENNIKIDTQNWSAGTYFISVSTEKGTVNRKLNVVK